MSGSTASERDRTAVYADAPSRAIALADRMLEQPGMKKPTPSSTRRKIVTLADVAPRPDITAGTSRWVFGATPTIPDRKRPANVGRRRPAGSRLGHT